MFVLLLNSISFYAQEIEKPFIVSPLIGDTLSIEERDYYNLLPTINGFQFAIFYLNADSLLDVRVSYLKRGETKDTLITNYKSLDNLKIHLFKVDIENSRRVTAHIHQEKTFYGSLLSASDNSILIYNEECDRNYIDKNCINRIETKYIDKLIVEGESNIGLATLWGPLIGAGIGSLIGVLSGAIYDNNDLSIGIGLIYGSIIGSIVGLVGGFTYGYITSTPDIIIEPFTEDNIKGLSQYSVYRDGEPDELKKIK